MGARPEGEDLRRSMVKVSLTRILEKKGQLTVLIAGSCFTARDLGYLRACCQMGFQRAAGSFSNETEVSG